MDRTSKTHVCPLLIACFLGFSLGTKGQVELISSDTLRIDSLRVEEIKIGYAVGNQQTLSGAVDKVSEKRMNKGFVTTPLEALSGQSAGVSISSGENRAAMLSSVRVRGTTSLTGGNDPLVIIDGVSADLSALNTIYPADIESFTILKDASETAQYGSRGASGVIEVATKKGKSESFRVSYTGNYGVQSVYKNLEMLSADEFRAVARQLNMDILDLGNQTNFPEEITRLGVMQNHHIAFGGGTNTTNYRASIGMMDRKEVVQNNAYQNFTAKVNLSQKAFQDRFQLDMGLFGSLQKNNYLTDEQKTFYSAATFNPTFPNHRNPETGSWDQITNASQITNPLAWLEVQDDESNAHFNTHMKLSLTEPASDVFGFWLVFL